MANGFSNVQHIPTFFSRTASVITITFKHFSTFLARLHSTIRQQNDMLLQMNIIATVTFGLLDWDGKGSRKRVSDLLVIHLNDEIYLLRFSLNPDSFRTHFEITAFWVESLFFLCVWTKLSKMFRSRSFDMETESKSNKRKSVHI